MNDYYGYFSPGTMVYLPKHNWVCIVTDCEKNIHGDVTYQATDVNGNNPGHFCKSSSIPVKYDPFNPIHKSARR